MTQLPVAFTEKTRQLMGEERFERYLQSFEEEPPVSIRVNTLKMAEGSWKIEDATPVPWCRNAFYLQKRPNFTMDPLLHAGCYYVQEAASMFLDEALKQMHTAYISHQPSDRLQLSISVRLLVVSQPCYAVPCPRIACSTATNPSVIVPISYWRT
jgi:hypothetical protein